MQNPAVVLFRVSVRSQVAPSRREIPRADQNKTAVGVERGVAIRVSALPTISPCPFNYVAGLNQHTNPVTPSKRKQDTTQGMGKQ